MSPYVLEAEYYNHTRGHFFDDKTLRFFGERRSEMNVLQKTAKVKTYKGTSGSR